MRIISTPLPAPPEELVQGRPAIVMALDTLVDDKSVVVGLAVGAMDGPDLARVRVSAVGQVVIDRCARHLQLNYPDASVVVSGVAQVAGAKKRVRQVLTQAPEHAFVLLLCANGKVYDAAYPALGIDLKATHQGAQR